MIVYSEGPRHVGVRIGGKNATKRLNASRQGRPPTAKAVPHWRLAQSTLDNIVFCKPIAYLMEFAGLAEPPPGGRGGARLLGGELLGPALTEVRRRRS